MISRHLNLALILLKDYFYLVMSYTLAIIEAETTLTVPPDFGCEACSFDISYTLCISKEKKLITKMHF